MKLARRLLGSWGEGIGKKILLFLSNPPADILQPRHLQVKAWPLCCRLKYDLGHITKGLITKYLTRVGIYPDFGCRITIIQLNCRHGLRPHAWGKVLSVTTEAASDIPWGGEVPC